MVRQVLYKDSLLLEPLLKLIGAAVLPFSRVDINVSVSDLVSLLKNLRVCLRISDRNKAVALAEPGLDVVLYLPAA